MVPTQVVDPLALLAPQVVQDQVEQVVPTQVVDPLALLAPQVVQDQVEQVVPSCSIVIYCVIVIA